MFTGNQEGSPGIRGNLSYLGAFMPGTGKGSGEVINLSFVPLRYHMGSYKGLGRNATFRPQVHICEVQETRLKINKLQEPLSSSMDVTPSTSSTPTKHSMQGMQQYNTKGDLNKLT